MELAGVGRMVDDVASRALAPTRASDDQADALVRAGREGLVPPADSAASIGAATLGTVPQAEAVGSIDELARRILTGQVDQVTQAEWKHVAALLEGGDHLPGTDLLVASGHEAKLAHLALERTWHDPTPMEAARTHDWLDRVRNIVALEGTTASDRTTQAAALLDRPVDQLGADDVRHLEALLDTDVQKTIALPRAMAGVPRLEEVFQAYRADVVDAPRQLRRYLEAWQVAKVPAEGRAAEAEALMALPASELDAGRLDRLAMLIDVDVAGAIVGPRTMSPSTLRSALGELMRAVPARDAAHERAAAAFARHDPEGAAAALDRIRARASEPTPSYFDSDETFRAYQASELDAAERTLSMIRRDPRTLGADELELLGSKLGQRRDLWGGDDDAWHDAIAAVKEVTAERTTVDLYRQVLGTFQEAWALARTPVEGRVVEAEALLARATSDLGQADLRRLRLLLAADVTGAIQVPREIAGRMPLERLASQLSRNEVPDLHELRPYRAAWQAARLDDATRAAELARLRDLDAAAMVDDDIDLLRALVARDPSGSHGLPPQLPHRSSLDELLDRMQLEDGPGHRKILQEYFDARSLETVGHEARIAEASELLALDATLAPSQASRLRSLLVSTGTHGSDAPGTAAVGSDEALLRALDEVAFASEDLRPFRQAALDIQRASYVLRDEPVEKIASRAAALLSVPVAQRTAFDAGVIAAVAARPERARVVELLPMALRLDLAHALQAHGSTQPYLVAEGLTAARDVVGVSRDAVPALARPLADRAVTRIDDELARMRGELRPGMVVGYARYPDYAELGRISADLQTLAGIARAERNAAAEAAATTVVW